MYTTTKLYMIHSISLCARLMKKPNCRIENESYTTQAVILQLYYIRNFRLFPSKVKIFPSERLSVRPVLVCSPL